MTVHLRFQAQKNDAKQFFYFSCELNHNGVAGSPRYSSSEGNGGPVAIASPISRSPIKENNAQENEFKRIMQEEIFTRQRLNAEDFDKSILTYASAGIAISITLLTTIIPFKVASYLGYLYLTWASFLSAIVATISSFYTGNKGLDEQLEFILQNQNKQSFWDGCTHVLNMISGVAFILGIVFALIFFYKNLNKDKPKESLF
ncbi:MAG: hypothetical protein IT497_05755 [Ottowia sp.]|nr:hypothetical protein [Ottowia sp.]